MIQSLKYWQFICRANGQLKVGGPAIREAKERRHDGTSQTRDRVASTVSLSRTEEDAGRASPGNPGRGQGQDAPCPVRGRLGRQTERGAGRGRKLRSRH